MKIRIKQIFLGTDLRQGEVALTEFLNRSKHPKDELSVGEIYLFFNRQMNKMRGLPRRGMLVDHKDGNGTYDFRLHREEILKKVGEFLGIKLEIPYDVEKEIKKRLGIKEVSRNVRTRVLSDSDGKKVLRVRRAAASLLSGEDS